MQAARAFETADFVNRRQAERFALRLPVRIDAAGGESGEGMLVDLSTSGFRAHAAVTARPGGTVWLRLAGQMPVGARLIWSNDGVHGGAFTEPLPPGLVRRLVEQGRVDAPAEPERTPMLVDLLRRTREGLRPAR